MIGSRVKSIIFFFSVATILQLFIFFTQHADAFCCYNNRRSTCFIVSIPNPSITASDNFNDHRKNGLDGKSACNAIRLKAKQEEGEETEQPVKKNPFSRFFSRFGNKKQNIEKEEERRRNSRALEGGDKLDMSSKKGIFDSLGESITGARDKANLGDGKDVARNPRALEGGDKSDVSNKKGLFNSLGESISGARDKVNLDEGKDVREIDENDASNKKGIFSFLGGARDTKSTSGSMEGVDEESNRKNSMLEALGSFSGAGEKISEIRLSSTTPSEEKKLLDLERSKIQKRKEKEQRKQQMLQRKAQEKQKKLAKIEAKKRNEEQKLLEATEKARNKSKSNFDLKGLVAGGIGNTQSFVSTAWDSVFSDDEEWIVAFPKTRISPGEVVPITVGGIDLLIVASKDAKKLHCFVNSCPHLGTPLETGRIEERPKENFLYGSDVADTENTKKSQIGIESGGDCEDCIVCPLHQTAFALESGEVRGEWCPYPPVIGKMMGAIKPQGKLSRFAIRARGKNIEVRINSSITNNLTVE